MMFAASIIVSLVTGFHMFTHDLSPMLLAMLLMVNHLPKGGHRTFRSVVLALLVVLWIPLIYFVLTAAHAAYVLFPVLMIFSFAALWLGTHASDVPHAEHATPS